jgi:hypothetical protein
MYSPSTIGRPAVPWMVVTPDVMLKGAISQADEAGSMKLLTPPENTKGWRRSLSDRPQSFDRSNGSMPLRTSSAR